MLAAAPHGEVLPFCSKNKSSCGSQQVAFEVVITALCLYGSGGPGACVCAPWSLIVVWVRSAVTAFAIMLQLGLFGPNRVCLAPIGFVWPRAVSYICSISTAYVSF